MTIYYPQDQYGKWVVTEQSVKGLWKSLSIIDFIRFIHKCNLSKQACQEYCGGKNLEREVFNYDRWWHCMSIPLIDISQEDLEWAAKQDQYNSYTSKNIFLQEIERRKAL